MVDDVTKVIESQYKYMKKKGIIFKKLFLDLIIFSFFLLRFNCSRKYRFTY